MKKISAFFVSALIAGLPTGLSAQVETAVFEATFDDGFPANVKILDLDGSRANSLLEDYGFGNASPWLTTRGVIKDGENRIKGGVAVAASYFEDLDAPAADDYLIFRDIALPENTTSCTLSWEALSLDPAFTETYEVYIAEGDITEKEHFAAAGPALRVANETGAAIDSQTNLFGNWAKHTIDLSAYSGKRISIAFHLSTPSGFLLLLDNVRVTASEQKPLPALLAETIKIKELEDGSVTISWKKIPEATSYLVSLYSRDTYASAHTYLFEKKETDKSGVAVKSIPRDKPLYVRIAGKRGEEIGGESEEVPLVASLDRTALKPPTGLELVYTVDKIYTVGWNAVPIASSYEALAYTHEIAREDGIYELREDFGAIPAGSLEEPAEMLYGGIKIDDYCKIKGWGGNVLALAKGGVVIKNRFKGFNWSYFDCPTMTLGSARTGNFSLELSVASQPGDSVEVKLYERIANKDSVALLETVRRVMTKAEDTLRFDFSKGKPESFVSIEVHTFQTENALIDEVVIRRPMKKDEEMKLLRSAVKTQTLRAVFPEQTIGIDDGYYSFTVCSRAICRKIISSLPAAEVYSKGKPEGCAKVDDRQKTYSWRLTPEGILLDLLSPKEISIFTLDGRRIYEASRGEGSHIIPLPATGGELYLLRIGSDTVKISPL